MVYFRLDSVPDSWDWRATKGVVPSVIDQGEMGNSFVLDVAEVVSSYHAIKTGKSVVASAQELVDCCTPSYSDFVNSDTTFTAPELADIWKCIVNLGGLCSKADYHTGNPCGSSQCQPVANVPIFFLKKFPSETTPSSIEKPTSSSKIKQSIEKPTSSSKIKQSIRPVYDLIMLETAPVKVKHCALTFPKNQAINRPSNVGMRRWKCKNECMRRDFLLWEIF